MSPPYNYKKPLLILMTLIIRLARVVISNNADDKALRIKLLMVVGLFSGMVAKVRGGSAKILGSWQLPISIN